LSGAFMKFNKKGFIKFKSGRYKDTIILAKYDWVAKQARDKGHIAYTVKELDEFLTMTKKEQDIWHHAKRTFGGHYVGQSTAAK
jgi:hypothetical protein